jgi:hypothetical protein
MLTFMEGVRMKRFALLAMVLLAIALAGCSGENGNTLPNVTDGCPQKGTRTCGLDDDGDDAVLLCSASLQWEVDSACPENCIFDSALGAVCQGSLPTDIVIQAPEDTVDSDIPIADATDDLQDIASTPDVPIDVPDQEYVFPDLMPDLTPPWVESTTPEDDEMGVSVPFVVTIQFTEPMHAVTVEKSTVRMYDAGGTDIEMKFEWLDEETSLLQLIPAGAIFHSSPYTITLDPIIKDKAGNSMGNTYAFSFYTEAVPSLDGYAELAGKYAPLIYQETNGTSPQFDYPARFNMDDDWVAEDNVEFIKSSASTVEPTVHYSVTETKSHFFITYVFFYPYRYAEDEGNRFGNDVSGALVIVRKVNEAPVAVETYFKRETDERSFSFITDESQLLPAGKTFSDLKFDGMMAVATLFPGNRYVAYLSAQKHESCLWLDENNGFLDGCILNAGIKNGMQKIELSYKNGAVDILKKEGSKFPQAKSDVGFALVHMLDSWWPRRADIGSGKMWAGDYKYEPDTHFANRPSISTKIPTSFIDPIGNDYGRPPWSWKHKPGNGASYFDMPRGVWFLDPAVHFKLRHDQSNGWEDYNTQSGTGWSLEYCFNPYFNLDFRGIWPECSAK